MPSWTVPPPQPNLLRPKKQYSHTPEWYQRKAARDAARRLALRQEAEDLGVPVRSLRPPPTGTRLTAPKSMQIGFRLADEELALFDRVNAHLSVPSFSAWVQYCIGSMLGRPEREALRSAFANWKSPTPGVHQKNVCVTAAMKQELLEFARPMQKFATAARFAMFIEAQYYLLQPSAVERAAVARPAAVQAQTSQVLIPTSDDFELANPTTPFWGTTENES